MTVKALEFELSLKFVLFKVSDINLMFDYNSKEINETWNEISVNNNTACKIDDAVTLTSHYSKAGSLMMLVLLGNLLSYVIGVILSNPAWIDQIIDIHKIQVEKYSQFSDRIKLIFFSKSSDIFQSCCGHS